MKISKQARRDAKGIFRSCQTNGLLDESRIQQAVTLLVAKKPRAYVSILTQIKRLVKLDLDRRTARIESPVPLTPELQSSLQESLTRTYGPGLNFNFAQNPALLGGLRIKVGSDVYDGTVQGRLQALQEKF